MNSAEVKKATKRYLGKYTAPSSNLCVKLNQMVAKNSEGIYLNADKLPRALKEVGVDDTDVLKICLMTTVKGFHELVRKGPKMQQMDLGRYIQSAMRETGLNHATVMELTRDIMLSIGIAFDLDPNYVENAGEFSSNRGVYVVPASVYQRKLGPIQEALEENIDPSPDDLYELEILAEAGLPKAKYYQGCRLLRSSEDPSKGIQLLREAADDGDTEASAKLGDYYYELGCGQWSTAYNYYTGFGALALNERRKKAVVCIRNWKHFNDMQFVLSFVLLLLMAISIVIAPGAPIYPPYRLWGCAMLIVGSAIWGLTLCHHIAKPYDEVFFVPVGIFAAWSIYIAVRLLL